MNARNIPVRLLYNINPLWPQPDIQDCHAEARRLVDSLAQLGHSIQEVCVQSPELEKYLEGVNPQENLIFNWCEELPGVPHSASLVARALDRMGFTYTGTGADALVFSQDKRKVKARLRAQGIPTPRWHIAATTSSDGWNCYPAIVKPAFEHCSFGVTCDAVVLTHSELAERIQYVLETFRQPALVEEFIDGREFHISVLGDGRLHALPVAEMDFSAFDNVKDRLCTYESKFDPLSTSYKMIELHLPASLTRDEQRQIEAVGLAAYRATGCRDYARLDLRLRDGVFYVLDVNPNADFSPDTSLAMSAELSGLTYGQLSSLLVQLAAGRHPQFSLDR